MTSADRGDLFSRPEAYDNLLERGLRLSGEGRAYFARGRIRELARCLPAGLEPKRVLDFGCGIGDSTLLLADQFLRAHVVGCDASLEALAYARRHHASDRCTFLDSSAPLGSTFDVCYLNGVLHHIDDSEHAATLERIALALNGGGFVAIFENNPASPPARMVMARIPFDDDAAMLWPHRCRRLLRGAGLSVVLTSYLFYFPRWLGPLRIVEPALRRFPLGAQYMVLGRKSP